MFRKLPRKRLAAVGFVAALAITGVSVAYFTGASGSVNGSGSVGSSSAWSVTTSAPTWSTGFTALYPGATNDVEYIPFTVTNNGKGSQSLTNLTVSLLSDGTNIETAGGTAITGCKATGFQVTKDASNAATPTTVAPGGTYTGKVDLTMVDDGTNQNNCQGTAPGFTITAS